MAWPRAVPSLSMSWRRDQRRAGQSAVGRALVVASALILALAACTNGESDVTGTSRPTDSSSESSSTRPAQTDPPRAIGRPTPTTVTMPVEVEVPATSVWVHLFDDTIKTPAGVEALLDEVEAAGIEAVFAQVARRHDAYFDSNHLPSTPDPGLTAGLDVLEALVEGAHDRGIQLHAWFVVAPVYHHQYDTLEMPEDHVWVRHGPDSDDSWMTVGYSGTVSRDYLDVALPAVHDHVAAMITDIAGRYEVDGIHLDYVRYDGAPWGYHPEVLAQFQSDTGRSDHPSPADAEWVRWRQGRTAALMERAHVALADARPGALLSAAVIAGGQGPVNSPGGFAGTRAAAEYLQDWPSWLDEDLVDFVMAMAYTREENAEHAGWFRQWVAFAGEVAERHPGRVGVGVGAYLNPVDAALTQIDLVLSTTGVVGVYSYQQDSSSGPRGQVLAQCCGSG